MSEIDELRKKLDKAIEELSILDDNARNACEANNENIAVVAKAVVELMAKIMPMYKIHKAEEELALMRLIDSPIGRQKYPM